jgi:hypothetical protein
MRDLATAIAMYHSSSVQVIREFVTEEIIEEIKIHQLLRTGDTNGPTMALVRIGTTLDLVPCDSLDDLTHDDEPVGFDHMEQSFCLESLEEHDLCSAGPDQASWRIDHYCINLTDSM